MNDVHKHVTINYPPVQKVWDSVKQRDPDQNEFLQAVEEVLQTIQPVIEKRPELAPALQRLVEPERMIIFRVPWIDDEGNQRVNRAFRVEFSSALGPYKGGLRFHPTVNLSIIKFLGFEQILKNSLTTLPMGAGKGGSDFDPKGKSDNEVMKFCQSFMTELQRHIGPNTDVPAGDIGVGGREIGFLFGQYKRIRNEFTGVLTGKGMHWGGSNIRPEATGYGTVYFVLEMLKESGEDIQGKRVLISGSGNVAQFAAEKLILLGAKPLTMSDSNGTIIVESGITPEILKQVMVLKDNRGRLRDLKHPDVKYIENQTPWSVTTCDIALPCATQNEIDVEDAKALVAAGCKHVGEGANMPTTTEAVHYLHKNGVGFGPAKAANAGGVAVSGLEMSQNSVRLQWSREEVDEKLQKIMKDIYRASKDAATEYKTTLQAGANIAGFIKIAEAMTEQGLV
eukprot:TRINITY_DN15456_c0_g1_i11.p1 TRINITY_DN15456_c0_g1~~TRINITY_DN15456_c0_g1_i11.p1  ORF type:complete len:452 (-),score=116.52 TRINITY_DN15456_c0_g1_i11:479-1834(-)